jgi:hypothetical protein
LLFSSATFRSKVEQHEFHLRRQRSFATAPSSGVAELFRNTNSDAALRFACRLKPEADKFLKIGARR